MMSSLLQSLALISLIKTITAQNTTATPVQGCARYRDYPLNICFNTSNGSMIIQCDIDQNYTENTYVTTGCEGNVDSSKTLDCVENSDCVCQSNNECDYAFYMQIDGIQDPITDVSQCNGTIWQNRPIIINQCLVTNDTTGIEQLYECPETNTNNTNAIYELTITSCTNGLPSDGAVPTTRPLCSLECPEEIFTCGRYHYSPLNACAITNINGNIQSKSITCTAPGEYIESIYDNEFCTDTAESETPIICTEGSECICNNDNPCEYATTKNYTNDADNTCVGESYEEILYVLDVCLSSRLGQQFEVNTQLTCLDGYNPADALWADPCGKDSGHGTGGIMNVCDVQCRIYGNVSMENMTTTTFVSTTGTDTATTVVCDRVSTVPVGVCLQAKVGESIRSYELTCNEDDLNYTTHFYMSENCTGTAMNTETEACNGTCYCGTGTPCPYAIYKVYIPSEECARYGFVPLNYCGRVDDNGTLISEKVVCNARTGVFSYMQYDDDQCQGGIIEEEIYDCVGTFGEENCICSSVECDYVSWNKQTAVGNDTGTCSGDGDIIMDLAAILDECYDFSTYTNVKMICNNNSVNLINCTDNITIVSDFLKTECDVICTDVIEATSQPTTTETDYENGEEYVVSVCDLQCIGDGTTQPTTTDDSDPDVIDAVCFGDTYVELAMVFNECIDGVEATCGGNDTLYVQSCGEIPDTTDTIETTDSAEIPETTGECYDKSGRGIDGDFDIGVYINCRAETIQINITYNNYNGTWFGILFAESGQKMYGEALIYTTGKINENMTNITIPRLYLYMLEGTTRENVNYDGGVDGERDWEKIYEKIDANRAELVYKQDLDETAFNLTTDGIAIRWGRGENDGSGHMLGYHTMAGRASADLSLQLQDISPTSEPTTAPEKDNASGIIIGAVIGAFFAVMICFGLIWAYMDHRKGKDTQSGSGYGAVGTTEDVEMQGTR